MAVTGLTRNQFIGVKPVRGFESLRLRWNFKSAGGIAACRLFFVMAMRRYKIPLYTSI